MDIQEKKKIEKRIMLIITGMMAVIVAYLVYAFVSKNVNMLFFKVLLGTWLAVYILLVDVIEPKLLKQLENISKEQMSSYYKYIGLDILSIGALAFFVFNLGSENQYGLIAAGAYFIAFRFKGQFKKEWLGIDQEKKEEETAEQSEFAEEPVNITEEQEEEALGKAIEAAAEKAAEAELDKAVEAAAEKAAEAAFDKAVETAAEKAAEEDGQ